MPASQRQAATGQQTVDPIVAERQYRTQRAGSPRYESPRRLQSRLAGHRDQTPFVPLLF
jgi:hypothetical protein